MTLKGIIRSLKRRARNLARLWRQKNQKEGYSHAAIAEDAAPSEELSIDYGESLDLFDNVLRDSMYVSKAHSGIPSPTTKHFYASVLFTALISRGVSLAMLAPHSPWTTKLIEHWDYASTATLARTMIELRAAFHYLCIDGCTEDEWNCRWNLLNLHDCNSRRRLFAEAQNAQPDQLDALEEQAEELRERLRSNRHFASLRNQKQLLNGQTAYLYPLETLIEKAGMDKQAYRFLNILFSSAVHGLPMSYYRMGEQERGRGLPSPVEQGYTSICLSLAASLLAATRDDLRELFKELVVTEERGNPESELD